MSTKNPIQIENKILETTYQVWQSMKAKFPDVVVLVRKDEHYYTFGSDAEVVSTLMDLKTEERNMNKSLCYLPHYCTDKLLQSIVKAGRRIALCDPLSSFKK